MRKKIIIFFAVTIACLAFGWYWFNKPRETARFKSADFAISAAYLFEAYNSNETEADKLYLNKIIEVKGIVDDIASSGEDIILTLGLQPPMGGISCRFSPGKEVVNRKIEKGTEIIVKGKCTGFNMDVNLADCVIISK